MAPEHGRLKGLDILRGFTISAMILVNSSGYIPGAYPSLRHAPWDGWTFADTIFPSFLWIVGFSLTLSTAKRLASGAGRSRLLRDGVRRAALLYGCGLLLQPLPYLTVANIHLTGVLQKIAVCYLLALMIFLWTPGRRLVMWIVALQILYLVLMLVYPVPGCLDSHWTKECNFSGFMTRSIHDAWNLPPPPDPNPDSLFTFLPATTTVLIGVLSGQLFRKYAAPQLRLLGSLSIGCVLILGGELLANWIPINKQLWTTSYVLVTAGLTCLCFGACCWLAERPKTDVSTKPFEIFGMNAIAAYALSILGSNVPKVHYFGVSLDEVLLRIADSANASLLFALANVVGVYLIVYWMYRRGWFLKL